MSVDVVFFFFFNDTATTEIYTLSLHDALPICIGSRDHTSLVNARGYRAAGGTVEGGDRKSTRLNSSHLVISYAVFCLKKKSEKRLAYNCACPSRSAITTAPPAPQACGRSLSII